MWDLLFINHRLHKWEVIIDLDKRKVSGSDVGKPLFYKCLENTRDYFTKGCMKQEGIHLYNDLHMTNI